MIWLVEASRLYSPVGSTIKGLYWFYHLLSHVVLYIIYYKNCESFRLVYRLRDYHQISQYVCVSVSGIPLQGRAVCKCVFPEVYRQYDMHMMSITQQNDAFRQSQQHTWNDVALPMLLYNCFPHCSCPRIVIFISSFVSISSRTKLRINSLAY